jgi:hypothetical protein
MEPDMSTNPTHVRPMRAALAIALAGMFAVGVAAAQAPERTSHPAGHGHADNHGHAHGGNGHGKHGRAHGMLKQMDTDGDGAISRAEFDAHRLSRIAAMDADGDGYVSFEEMEAHRQAQREQRARARFDRLDTDGDGRVSLEELAAMGERRFERMDRNGDGVLDADDRMGRHEGMRRVPRGD